MMHYYFTFGSAHRTVVNGITINERTAVLVNEPDFHKARARMKSVFGMCWASQYTNHQFNYSLYRGNIISIEDLELSEYQIVELFNDHIADFCKAHNVDVVLGTVDHNVDVVLGTHAYMPRLYIKMPNGQYIEFRNVGTNPNSAHIGQAID